MNWNETLIRASSVGYLMTEPVTKADKEAGVLSKTAQKHLLEVYVAEKYGRKKDISTKQMRKGNEVEEEAIDFLSEYLGHYKGYHTKNINRYHNEYIAGTPDVVSLLEGNGAGPVIYDVKSSYDLWTFTNNMLDKVDNLYYWQMQSYMWLVGAKKAYVAFCLLDTPFGIVEQEKKSLLYKMNVISEESPEYLKEALKLEFNMTFNDIPAKERILIFPIDRNDDDILRIQAKVEKAREFLHQIESLHSNFNK
jgi:hypothetical protein